MQIKNNKDVDVGCRKSFHHNNGDNSDDDGNDNNL